jgi:hypothetical protein
VDLDPDYADAHAYLSLTLVKRGKFQEAIEALRRGHELGSRQPGWKLLPEVKAWQREAEFMARLDARLPALLQGKEQPRDARERVAVANLLQHKQRFATAARWYSDAFAEAPSLEQDLNERNRYVAARAAALAGCGQGKDAAGLAEQERARMRQQALGWLRDDMATYRRLLDGEPEKAGPLVRERMQHWQQDSDFGGVRGLEVLARLPEAERHDWDKLWTDVADTLARAQRKTASAKKRDNK